MSEYVLLDLIVVIGSLYISEGMVVKNITILMEIVLYASVVTLLD